MKLKEGELAFSMFMPTGMVGRELRPKLTFLGLPSATKMIRIW
jgi:hypothetical protein